jgi:hypothetical protein
MHRIIKIIALAALALLATAAVASASVAVTDGTGFVGKGDVQNALGLNDVALQTLYKSKPDGTAITFTSSWTKVYDNMFTCADGKEVHVDNTITGTRTIEAAANTNKTGKVSDGWNLTGGTSTTVSDDIQKTIATMFTACLPDKPLADMTPAELRTLPVKVRVSQDQFSTFNEGLQVNGQDLPNTPVVPTV